MAQRTCTIEGCGRTHYGRGWCRRHYKRWRAHGDPIAGGTGRPARRTVHRRFPAPGVLIVRHDADEYRIRYDDADHQLVAPHPWYVGAYGYVVTNQLRMHRTVLGLALGDGLIVDHINGDRLDNRRANLRIVPNAINIANQRVVNGRGSSRYRGVSWHSGERAWRATHMVGGRAHHLGLFSNEEIAAAAVAAFRAERRLPAGY